ncbi:uncharacterized protein LY79DRAFT_405405 [Colletotrichum navitas]|uniref:Uncharacterized protein n=1 Tax=Colletotrichum navitas TaxID=681940 RepID=A0AAD8V9S8_9PEZI|nr:uncharacterized protein LY79DRAFT_405405 [Colletotrichum navitas]KAK1597111.1 hypothetical protein LY79DRAFT_405405 [Colletotrichum navitas]
MVIRVCTSKSGASYPVFTRRTEYTVHGTRQWREVKSPASSRIARQACRAYLSLALAQARACVCACFDFILLFVIFACLVRSARH